MKIEFAPRDVPLHRRLQTAAVLQWVYSFLALGESSLSGGPPPLPLAWQGRCGGGAASRQLLSLRTISCLSLTQHTHADDVTGL
ncbi:hypothetical protein CRUP_017568 [Coryphaenoides rupestris]|nr:hypothetical protein CRUP_017568 [Coryphaenoides rupestris]